MVGKLANDRVASGGLDAVIVGPGRSGSTTLVGLLNKHPDIFCLNESHSLPPLVRHFGKSLASTRDLAECLLKLYFPEGPYWPKQTIVKGSAEACGRSEEDFREYLDELCVSEPEMDIHRFQRFVYGYFQDAAAAHLLIDKTPDYACHLDLVHEVFPKSKVILMVRDAPASVLSMRLHNGYRIMAMLGALSWGALLAERDCPTDILKVNSKDAPKNLPPYLHIWSERIMAVLDHCHGLPPEQFMILRYEDLISAPKRAGKRLLKFLGLPANREWVKTLGAEYRLRPYSRELIAAEQIAAANPQVMKLRQRLGYS